MQSSVCLKIYIIGGNLLHKGTSVAFPWKVANLNLIFYTFVRWSPTAVGSSQSGGHCGLFTLEHDIYVCFRTRMSDAAVSSLSPRITSVASVCHWRHMVRFSRWQSGKAEVAFVHVYLELSFYCRISQHFFFFYHTSCGFNRQIQKNALKQKYPTLAPL